MKKKPAKQTQKRMRHEYDFSHGQRGKYAAGKLEFLIEEARDAVGKSTLRDWPKPKR
jgi:hypothetical protein